jgi:hypothetical protein
MDNLKMESGKGKTIPIQNFHGLPQCDVYLRFLKLPKAGNLENYTLADKSIDLFLQYQIRNLEIDIYRNNSYGK